MNTFPNIDKLLTKNISKLSPNLHLGEKKLDLTNRDLKICKEILKIYESLNKKHKYKSEWSWINDNKRSDFLATLKRKNIKKLSNIFSNFFLNSSSFGIISWDFKKLKSKKKNLELISNIYKDFLFWSEFVQKNNKDIKFLNSFKNFGNCYGLKLKNQLIMVDTPRHDYFANKIIKLIGKKKSQIFTEIGGGYGGLIFQLLKRGFKGTIINVDIIETLLISYFFLRKFTKKKIIICDLEKKINFNSNNIYLCTPEFFLKLKSKINLIFNCHSFSEMSKNDLNLYLKKINKIKVNYFLHQNSNILLYPDSKRHVEILAKDFPINLNYYNLIYSQVSMWSSGSGRYREYLYKKK
tara:strand:+ start:68 stop:1123 length:1056 start_codon:yes stop_codon:yes gene_type:complete